MRVVMSGIEKTYRSHLNTVNIFSNYNLAINSGEFVAIMGPSGAGKTSLLNFIGTIDAPDAGSIICDGIDITGFDDRKRARWRANRIGFVFQFYNLIPVCTARQNVELPLQLIKMSANERRRRVSVALDLVQISERSAHKPREMSGGEQQRVAIARALVTDPPLLLCDEPTGDLDRDTADHILKTLRTCSKAMNKTVIMVTHDPKAAAFADRTVHLEKSRKQAC